MARHAGIHESSDLTTNLATCARCLGGNALNCLMRVCAVVPPMNHDGRSLAGNTQEQGMGLMGLIPDISYPRRKVPHHEWWGGAAAPP